MSAPDPAKRAEELRRAVLEFLVARQAVAFESGVILDRILRARVLDFRPDPDEFAAALSFLENFSPEPLIHFKRALLGSTRFYQATSAGALAFERGALNS